jgi:hypothetical protein
MATLRILEPMSAGDVIDRAVRLYRRNFVPLVAVVAVPTLIGYITSLLFWFGYSQLFAELESSRPDVSGGAMLLMGLGMLGYPVWFFSMLMTISGLSRVIGDHVMLDAPVTFRGCFSAVRRRLGDIFLMGLLSIAVFVGMYVLFSIIAFILIMLAVIIIGLTAAAGMPNWISGTIVTIVVLAAVALGIFIILLVVSRFIFMPQIMMLEGLKAGAALGRAVRLGGGNWYKVGAIGLFTYFISLSLLAALTLPMIAVMELLGVFSTEFFLTPTWNVLYTAFNQLSNLLTVPILVLSVTLLYFDSRVRKEAYDLELLARELSPGFYWQPTVETSAFGYQMPVPLGVDRVPLQTSPLGLAGYRPAPHQNAPPAGPPPASPPSTEGREDLRARFDRAAVSLASAVPIEAAGGAPDIPAQTVCRSCNEVVESGATFCTRCGAKTQAVT